MKAIEFTRYGIPHEVCACVEVPDPGAPSPGEIVVTVLASAINPADLLIIEGRYPGPTELPARQGIEGAGRVEAVRQGVVGLNVGDHVIILERANWAERVRVASDRVIKIPRQVDILQAAMMKANPPTALLMLRDYVDLKPGDWVVQNAANSAVGYHVIRLAKSSGVRTINVVRRESLVEPLKSIGADLVLVDGNDLGRRVRAEIGEDNVPVAFDAAGGPACLHLADCLSDGGILVNYGFLSGKPCMITPHHAIVHGIELKGFWLVKRLFQRSRDKIEEVYREVAQLINAGTINAPIEATYRLENAKDALAHAEREGRNGKILFTANEG
ncbi:MAG: zinc-dependent alcohol dehydrogenase family protein [Gammaproteobacteria bacterium]|nr:zinc-dependent alcohol dehydrogenase family protein [Gammaproteobacteria bacterium]